MDLRVVLQALQHAATGAAVAAGGLTAVQLLLSRRMRRPSALALSLGSFVGVFRLLEALGRAQDTQTTPSDEADSHAAPFAAAVAAALASCLLDRERKTVVVSYAVVEAALSLAKHFTTLSDIPYIDVPLGALAVGPLIDTWIYQSDAIAKSQLEALDGLVQLPRDVLQRMRAEIPSGTLHSRCDVFHRGRSCAQFHSAFFSRSMRFAARLYVPIYLASVLAPKYKRWLWGPRPALTPLALRYLRTCACLTMLYQVPLGFSCVSPIPHDHMTVMLAGALTTLAFQAEHKARRGAVMKAVGVYTTGAMATRAVAALGVSRQIVSAAQLVLFSAAAAVVFQRPGLESSRAMRLLYGYGTSVDRHMEASSTGKGKGADQQRGRESSKG